MANSDSVMAPGFLVSSRVQRGISSYGPPSRPCPRSRSLRSFGCYRSLRMTTPFPCHPECSEGSRPTAPKQVLPPFPSGAGSLRSFGCYHSLGMTMPCPSSGSILIRGVFLTQTSPITLAMCGMVTAHSGQTDFLTNLLETLTCPGIVPVSRNPPRRSCARR